MMVTPIGIVGQYFPFLFYLSINFKKSSKNTSQNCLSSVLPKIFGSVFSQNTEPKLRYSVYSVRFSPPLLCSCTWSFPKNRNYVFRLTKSITVIQESELMLIKLPHHIIIIWCQTMIQCRLDQDHTWPPI